VISLEQIKQLDIRVKKAVTAVKTLSAGNSALEKQVKELEAQLIELNKEASERKADEEQLEVSLQSVLDVLDEVDDETSEIEPEPPADNYVIETVSEQEDEDIVFTPNDSPQENSVSVEDDRDSISEEIVAEEVIAEEVVNDTVETPLKETQTVESDSTDSEESPETINLDSEKDNEGFQSEFDIF